MHLIFIADFVSCNFIDFIYSNSFFVYSLVFSIYNIMSSANRALLLPLWFTYHFFVLPAAAAAANSLQSCPTLCNPKDGSPPGSPVTGILQARTLEWVAISFSNTWNWKVKVKSLSRVRLVATPWSAAHQAPLSMGFSRQEYWSGVPLPSRSLCCLIASNSSTTWSEYTSLPWTWW